MTQAQRINTDEEKVTIFRKTLLNTFQFMWHMRQNSLAFNIEVLSYLFVICLLCMYGIYTMLLWVCAYVCVFQQV